MQPFDLDALRPFGDVEQLLIDWLTAGFAGTIAVVSTERPPLDDLATSFPYVQVEAFGGTDVNAAQDTPRVDVDVFTGPDADGNPDRGGASDLAELIRAAMLNLLPGYTTGPMTVQNVRTFSRPTARPYDDNPTLRRFSAAYELTVATRD